MKCASDGPVAEKTGAQYRLLLGQVWEQSTSDAWDEFARKVCEQLLNPIKSVKYLLPSALASALTQSADTMLCDLPLCTSILSVLELSTFDPEYLPMQFLLEFTLCLVTQIIAFITKKLYSYVLPRVSRKVHQQVDDECRQVIYYMAGSIIRGYFRIAYRYKSSRTWALIAEVMKSNVLSDKPMVTVDAAWTKSIDRGGLLHPNEKCQEFFVSLTSLIFLHENRDGSINFEEVLGKVLKSNMSAMWDEMIGDSLSESVSLNLLTDIVQCHCRACGRGFAKRRLNKVREKPMASMPTRHLVASRKK